MKLPKLHLRDLFWLVLLCACLCAWWIDRRNQEYRHARWRARAIWASEILEANELRFEETIKDGKIRMQMDSLEPFQGVGAHAMPSDERMDRLIKSNYPLP